MAATLTPDGELTYFSFPIEKSEETADGDLIVYGKATDGTVDSDLQIVDPEWSAKAIREWLDTGGNLRVQHQARRDPAGVGLEVDITPDGHFVKALVVEPVARELVRKRVLQDFSIGVTNPDIRPDPTGKAMNGIITGKSNGQTKISEISLVDRGSNFNSKFQLVKAASDGEPEFVGKMFGDSVDVITKAVTDEAIVSRPRLSLDVTDEQIEKAYAHQDGHTQLSIPDDVHVAFTPADLAKVLAKRKMDPDVGGGVDRDKIPAADFAGRDRSFPIVTPGDVSDAASSIGRAGGDNYSSDQLKKNIIRIARRKGASFVAELPEAWKKELGMTDAKKADEADVTEEVDADETKAKKKKPFAGAAPAFGKDEDEKDGDEDEKDSKSDKTAKGGTDPDDQVNDEDGDDEEEDDCDKSSDVDVEKVAGVEKKSKVMCPGCGANVHDEHKFCSECGDSLKKAMPIKKNHAFTCLDCGHQNDKGEKFCPACGKKNPGYLPQADSQIESNKAVDVEVTKKKKSKKATPSDAAEEAADTKPVPAHREPDGPAVEEFEKDSGMTEGDEKKELAAAKVAEPLIVPGDFETSASMRLKSLGVPLDYGVLHDLTCPCYHPDDVAKSYPRYDLSSLDANHWQAKAFDMAASAPLDQARKANELWQHVVTLKNTDPRYILEVRSELYKEFQDANPGPGSFPHPGAISPNSFNRPLITAGHEAPSPGHGGPNTAPDPFGSISASDYHRSYLTAGHAAESPSDQQGMMQPVSVPSTTGVPTRTYYTNAMRDNAKQAMLAMHDHIAQTFPDLCPAAPTGSPYGSGALPGSRPVPTGVGMPAPHSGGATKAAKPKKSKKDKHVIGIENPEIVKAVEPETTKAAVLDMATVEDLINKAVSAVNEARDAKMKELRKQLKKTNKALDVIAAQPDPGGPYRGVAFEQIQKSVVAQDVLPTAGVAERTQQNLFAHMYNQWRTSPDPMQREVAWQAISKMSGIDSLNK